MPRPAAPSFDSIGPWPELATVALACSGGADSTYLAWQWQKYLQKHGESAVRSVVWVVDHAHRDGTQDEAAQAQQIYQEMGYQVRVLQPDSPPESSSENHLRQLRYRLFAAQAKVDGASILLTAHHADDQAETVLLRILRGTGLHGLAGMPESRPLADFGAPELELRRPLLACRSAQIRAELKNAGLRWIEDPTNELPEAAARNRLRKQIMPLLGQVATGDPIEAILQLASDADQWRSWLDSALSEEPNWPSMPQLMRIEAIRSLLVVEGVRCTRQSLANWEQALLKNGSTAVNETHRLSVAGGRLRYLARKDPKTRR